LRGVATTPLREKLEGSFPATVTCFVMKTCSKTLSCMPEYNCIRMRWPNSTYRVLKVEFALSSSDRFTIKI
jgi:hypothetical protein